MTWFSIICLSSFYHGFLFVHCFFMIFPSFCDHFSRHLEAAPAPRSAPKGRMMKLPFFKRSCPKCRCCSYRRTSVLQSGRFSGCSIGLVIFYGLVGSMVIIWLYRFYGLVHNIKLIISYHWIGWRENLNRKPWVLHVFTIKYSICEGFFPVNMFPSSNSMKDCCHYTS